MFDPYHKWLGIPRAEQPPNHYRLLGITDFEADADVIDTAANRQMAFIQSCATGPHADASQILLNELAAARVCLLNHVKKSAYDAALRAKLKANQATPIQQAVPSPVTTEFAFEEAEDSPHPRQRGAKRRPLPLQIGGLTAAILLVAMLLVARSGSKDQKPSVVATTEEGNVSATHVPSTTTLPTPPSRPKPPATIPAPPPPNSLTTVPTPAKPPVPQPALLKAEEPCLPGELSAYQGESPRDIHGVACSSDGKLAATCGWFDPNIRLWDLKTGQVSREFPIGKVKHVNGIALSHDGRRLLASTGHHDGNKWVDCGFRIWDTSTGNNIQTHYFQTRVWGVAFCPAGHQFVVATGNLVRVFEANGKSAFQLKGHNAEVFNVAVSPDGRRVASIAMDHTIRVWDLASRREVLRIPVAFTDKEMPPPVAFDGRRVVSSLVGAETAIRVWDAAEGKLVASFTGHTDEVWALAISPDGQRVLSGGRDRTLALWEIDTGKELHRYTVLVNGSTPMIKAIHFSVDRQRALVGSNDRTLRIYQLPLAHPNPP